MGTYSDSLCLKYALSKENLLRTWRKVKKQFREELIRDPIDHLAYEAHLEANIGYLAYRLQNERYIPAGQTVVRSAKKDGLTRPLAFLEIEDQIAYKAICESLEDELLDGFPPWVNFSRSKPVRRNPDHQPDDRAPCDYETWFDAWIRHHTVVTKFVFTENENRFIVETDIANFFPSINFSLLRDHIFANTSAPAELINLLFSILQALIPKPGYSIAHNLGLPQENYDVSRTLAQAFLKPLDEMLMPLGQEGRYARWVDDIRIAVRDENEGKALLSKVQLCLEKLGLALNTGKTRIITRDKARQELLVELNSYLDRVHKAARHVNFSLEEFDDKLVQFLQLEPFGGWERVLRRFYTESRRVGSSVLEDFAWQHIIGFPQSAQVILKYLSGRPYSDRLLNELWQYLRSEANLYENVEILIYEFLLQWHLPQAKASDVARTALDHFFGRKAFKPPVSQDYTRALIALLVFKCSGYEELLAIRDYFEGSSDRHFMRYAYVVLMATTHFRAGARAKAISYEDSTLRRVASFIEELFNDPSKYLLLLRKYFTPQLHQLPDRYIIEARALPLIRICGQHEQFRIQYWTQIVDHAIKLLRNKTLLQWRDEVAISWLEQERQRA